MISRIGSSGTWIKGALKVVLEVKFGVSKELERLMSDIRRSEGFKDIDTFVLLRSS
jgi:hypothetical protein